MVDFTQYDALFYENIKQANLDIELEPELEDTITVVD